MQPDRVPPLLGWCKPPAKIEDASWKSRPQRVYGWIQYKDYFIAQSRDRFGGRSRRDNSLRGVEDGEISYEINRSGITSYNSLSRRNSWIRKRWCVRDTARCGDGQTDTVPNSPMENGATGQLWVAALARYNRCGDLEGWRNRRQREPATPAEKVEQTGDRNIHRMAPRLGQDPRPESGFTVLQSGSNRLGWSGICRRCSEGQLPLIQYDRL